MAHRPLTVQVGLGAILGGACAEAFLASGSPAAIVGGAGEIDAPWSVHTEAAFDTAESAIRGAMAPFDLPAHLAHVLALADHGRAGMPLLSDPDAAAAYEVVAALLESPEERPTTQLSDSRAGLAMSSALASASYERAVRAAGDEMPEAMREEFAAGIAAFYEYNNTSPTKPFAVDMDHVYERFPELEGGLEEMSEWAPKQDWGESNFRPAFG